MPGHNTIARTLLLATSLCVSISALAGPAATSSTAHSRTTSSTHKAKFPADDDLLNCIFPNYDDKSGGEPSAPIRRLHNNDDDDDLSGKLTAQIKSKRLISNAGRKDLLLELTLSQAGTKDPGWGSPVLALIKLGKVPKLLDAIDFTYDRENYIWDHPGILPAGNQDCPVVAHSHLSAGADYFAPEILEIVGNKFTLSRAELPFMFSGQGSDQGKGFEITENPTLKLVANSNPPQAILTVKCVGKLLNEDSETVKSQQTKTFTARLTGQNGRWTCPSCRQLQKNLNGMEKKFGFDTP